MHKFSRAALVRYRAAVLDPVRGERLAQLADAIGPELIGGRSREDPPRGLPADHPRAEWLLHEGLFAQVELPLPPELYTPALPERCLAQFTRLRPIQQWLLDLLTD